MAFSEGLLKLSENYKSNLYSHSKIKNSLKEYSWGNIINNVVKEFNIISNGQG